MLTTNGSAALRSPASPTSTTPQRAPAPSTAWKEVFLGGSREAEAALHARFAAEHGAIQKAIGTKLGAPLRGQHAGSLGDVKLRFEPNRDAPDFVKHGVFAAGGALSGIGRFSSADGVPTPDTAQSFRGFALSLNLPGGKKQDLLLTNTDVFMKSSQEVMALVRAKAVTAALPPDQAKAKFFEVATAELAKLTGSVESGAARAKFLLARAAVGKGPDDVSLALETFHGAMPIKVGPYAAKVSLHPVSQDKVSHGQGASYMKDDLQARLRDGEVAYELKLQLFESEATTPIEDLTNAWNVPYVTVGRVVVPRQDLATPLAQAVTKDIEKNPFSPWNTTEHQPLGEIGRARKAVYSESARIRGACPYGYK